MEKLTNSIMPSGTNLSSLFGIKTIGTIFVKSPSDTLASKIGVANWSQFEEGVNGHNALD